MIKFCCCLRSCWIIFLLVIHITYIKGQFVSFDVLDSLTKQAVSQATLQIEQYGQNEEVIARSFVFSDRKGLTDSVRISKKVHFIQVTINHIQYEPKELRLGVDKLENTFPILLRPQSYEVPEVTVTPEYVERNTSFVADSFRTVRTLRLRELVENIPDLSMVSGKLHYRNKEVESLLLDSVDIFGSEYSMLVNNLPTRFIESLEVLEDYQNNKQLEKFEEGTLTVNINTKEGKEFMLGGGGSLAANHSDVMNVSGDVSLISKNGIAVFADVNFNQWGAYPHTNGVLREGSLAHSYGYFHNIQGQFPIMSSNYQESPMYLYDNNYRGGKVNAAWRLSENWNAVFAIHRGADDASISNELDWEQDLGDANWAYFNRTTQEYENNIQYTNFKLTGNTEKGHHELYAEGALFSGRTAESVNISGDLIDTFRTESQLSPQKLVRADYEFTMGVGKDMVSILSVKGKWENRSENWVTSSMRLKDLFQLPRLDSVNLSQVEKRVQVNYSWIVKNQTNRWNFELDFDAQSSNWEIRYLADNQVIDELKSESIWVAYDSRARIQFRNYLPGFQKNTISFSLEGGSLFFRSHPLSDDFQLTFPFQSNVNYTYRNLNDKRFSTSLEYDQDIPDPTYFLQNNLALPSFTLISGLSELDLMRKVNLNMSFNSRELFSLWDYGFRAYYTYYWSKVSSQRTVRIENTVSEQYFDEAQTASVTGSVKRYFTSLPLSLKMKAQFMSNDFYQILNGERLKFQNQVASLSLTPKISWNVIDFSLETGLRQNTFNSQRSAATFRNLNSVSNLKFQFISKDQTWEFSTSAEYTYNYSRRFDLMIWDARISYNFSFGKLRGIFHNLFDQDLIDRRVDEISSYQIVQPLIGRYFAVQFDIVI